MHCEKLRNSGTKDRSAGCTVGHMLSRHAEMPCPRVMVMGSVHHACAHLRNDYLLTTPKLWENPPPLLSNVLLS